MGKTRAQTAPPGLTLDAGALIALDRGDGRMIALLEQAVKLRRNFRLPAGVLAQTWREGRKQALLARFVRTGQVEVAPLDAPFARACGELCGATGTFDIVDASVVILARDRGDVIVTSDPDDLQRLDPRASIVQI